jgi:predicted secreted hydrolase
MNVRAVLFLLLVFAAPAFAQGFAGLGTDAEGYRTVEPGRTFSFPADHGPHEGFRIEWWYVTANLEDADGNDYGLQWTLFRQALAPGEEGEGWESSALWMGHAGLTTSERHFSAEKFARGGIGQAGVTAAPLEAFIDDWALTGDIAAEQAPDGDTMAEVAVNATGADFSYAMTLTTERAPVLQGEAGYSVKSDAGQASYYYSQPFYRAEGTITVDGEEIPVTGTAWLDREWSSRPLADDQEGWDWFSLHLPGHDKLMLFQVRSEDGSSYYSGTWFTPDGVATPLANDAITMTPLGTTDIGGRIVPTQWRLEIPSRDFEITTEALNPQSWMATTFAYWEGPIRFSGTHEGKGYLEMTGYDAD